MLNFKNQSKQLTYFVVPFLLISGGIFWFHLRISQPDEAMKTAKQYLGRQFPGLGWELGQMMMVGESLSKKWRMEFSSHQNDERRIQASFLVDRWRPERLLGRFIVLLNPPQILDGGWESPTFLDRVSSRISRLVLLLIGLLFLIFQSFWLFRLHRRGKLYKLDGLALALLGGAVLMTLLVVEVHPGFMVAYALIFTPLGVFAPSAGGQGNV